MEQDNQSVSSEALVAGGGDGASAMALVAAAVDENAAGVSDHANGSGAVAENGVAGGPPAAAAAAVAAAAAAEQHLVDVSASSAEEHRLWSAVTANGLDFDAWTALADETEKVAENNIIKIRKVYDAFLAEFPLCFGYWKKYADHEGRLDGVDKVVEVYERAVLAVTYSVEIWLHYCVFAISTYEDPDVVRRMFERGLAYVGTDYLSYSLWDEYIRYEGAHQAWSHLAIIYTRILENPIRQLDHYFHCFKELAASQPLSEIRTAEEAALVVASVETDPQASESEIHPDGVEQSPCPVSAGLTEAEELDKYIAIREEMYKKAKEFDSKIVGFETSIKRPYFHVRALDDSELDNWHKYLDFIERQDDLNKVVRLYERCLIACANYPEYWIRYVLSMDASGSTELADNALARATQVFVKKQPKIHLFAAKFKELNGDVVGARAQYQLLYSVVSPYLLEAIVKHANMEYRLGNKEAAFSIYEKMIAAEQEKEQFQVLPLLLVQYSRFLYLVANDVEKARDTLSGLCHLQLSKPLLQAVIHLESIQPLPKRVEFLDSLVEKFFTPTQEIPNMSSIRDKEETSCIFMEFLDLFGDAQSIKKADNRHANLFLRHKRSFGSKKRKADGFLASEKEKVSRTDTSVSSSDQSMMGAYHNAQNQWSSGYGQSWSQNAQTQVQPWDPGYTPQSGYNVYANYGPPQMPTPAPQSASYGSYAPTYPAQAYPEQNYAQPAAAVAPAFPQQQAPAAQQYYGTYY